MKTPQLWKNSEPMDMDWNDVSLNAMDRDEWKEWITWCASQWKD